MTVLQHIVWLPDLVALNLGHAEGLPRDMLRFSFYILSPEFLTQNRKRIWGFVLNKLLVPVIPALYELCFMELLLRTWAL